MTTDLLLISLFITSIYRGLLQPDSSLSTWLWELINCSISFRMLLNFSCELIGVESLGSKTQTYVFLVIAERLVVFESMFYKEDKNSSSSRKYMAGLACCSQSFERKN